MSEYHFPVPGSEDEEKIVIFVRRHWVSFLGQFLLSFVMIIVPVVIIILIYVLHFDQTVFHGTALNFTVLLLSIYYLIAVTFAFTSWMSFYYNVYIVTRTEIIDISQVGFFGREIIQMPLLRVQDVTSSVKGFFQSLFSYGNVLVETASEQKEPFILCNVPNPQEIASEIMDLHDEVIEVEGRHHQLLVGEGALVSDKNVHAEESQVKPPPQPESEEEIIEKTPYRELLEKEKEAIRPPEQKNEGEITHDDLDKGGQIDLK